MKNINIGDRLEIQCYKHNGKIHRAWDEAVVLEINDDFIVVGNNKTEVTESDGRTWKTKEPAVIYFYKYRWFNVIGQLKHDGIYYYCNLATPYIIEDNTIKYIDYDLDLRVFPDGAFKILDKLEYMYHKKIINYDEEIDGILKKELTLLINKVRNKEIPFSEDFIKYYHSAYKLLVKNSSYNEKPII